MCICHFGKGQIHTFISKERYGYVITLVYTYTLMYLHPINTHVATRIIAIVNEGNIHIGIGCAEDNLYFSASEF